MKSETLFKHPFILDSHCDTPSMLLEGIDLGKRLDRGHFDFVRMKEGGVDGVFFSIYTPKNFLPDQATAHAINLISKSYDAVDANSNKVAFAFSPQDGRNNKERGLLSVFLGMENGSPINTNLSLLRLFYKFGIRYLTLCHNANNEICDSCAPSEKRWGGVSPFGKEVIAELNSLGVLIDCSHSSDLSFYDILKYSKRPIVATHSCCRALCNHKRNLTDEMIKDLASQGGVVQVNFYPYFLVNGFGNEELTQLGEQGEIWQERYRSDLKNIEYRNNYYKITSILNTYESISFTKIVDHIDHIVSLVGINHVGLGSDFDGIEIAPQGMRDISMYPNIKVELRRRGYSEGDIDLIFGENFLRVMDEVQN